MKLYNIEDLLILCTYLIAALSSIVDIGNIGSAIFILLVIKSILISSRNAFLLMFFTFYVPTGGLSLPVGPLILITFLTIVIWANKIFKAKRSTKIKIITILFVVIILFRLLSISFVKDYSLYYDFILLAIYTLLQILVVPTLINENDAKYILKWWVLFGVFAAILGYIHHLMDGNTYLTHLVSTSNATRNSFEVEGYVGWMRWIWAGVEPNFHGALLLLPYAIALDNVMKDKSITNFLLLLIITLGIFGTYSRTSFIISVLTFLLALALSPSVKRKISIITFVLIFFTVIVHTFHDYVERILSISENIKTSGGSGRFELYLEALENIALNPILGIGTGQTRLYSSTNMDTHNTYLQLFAENGLLCFTIVLFMITYIFRYAIRLRKIRAAFLLGLFAIGINLNTVSMFDLRPIVSFVVLMFIYRENNENFSSNISRVSA